MKKTLSSVLGAGFIIMAISFGGVFVNYDSHDDEASLKNYEESSLIPCVYAKKGGKGKGKDKAKKDKGKGKGRDKDRGPSVPGIPMAAAVIIGLSAIGAGAYFIKKKKK